MKVVPLFPRADGSAAPGDVLQVLDAAGRRVAYVDNVPGAGLCIIDPDIDAAALSREYEALTGAKPASVAQVAAMDTLEGAADLLDETENE